MTAAKQGYLERLGAYGFEQVEPVILAALVTEDPLILLGRSGTGKTYLLNSLSEALGLEHRHYNASLISFDDLVGFPYPDDEAGGVRFLHTPATVWGAESVLIDELSRCKPEHQNRLFSLVHERRLQGIALEGLRYRWAAMNPCSDDQDGGEVYTGSEALDPALADRFSLIVDITDWGDLDEAARASIAQPAGEGRVADDGGKLAARIREWRARFVAEIERCPGHVVEYAVAATTALNAAEVRISPRRSRLLARSLLAACIIEGRPRSTIFRRVLTCSLPQPCWGQAVAPRIVAAVHKAAWSVAADDREGWIHGFHAERRLSKKLGILIASCENPDQGTQAVAELLARETPPRAAAFAFAVHPAAALGRLPIGAEGVNDLGRVAARFLTTDGSITWQERQSEQGTQHPNFSRYAALTENLRGARRARARQFFNACLVEEIFVPDASCLEQDIEACVKQIKKLGVGS